MTGVDCSAIELRLRCAIRWMCVCVGVGEGYLYSAHATTRCGRKIAYVTPNINEDLKEFSREETDLHKLSLVHNTIQSILETIY